MFELVLLLLLLLLPPLLGAGPAWQYPFPQQPCVPFPSVVPQSQDLQSYEGMSQAPGWPSGNAQQGMHVFLFNVAQSVVAQHLAFAISQALPWYPSLQVHVLGALHLPLPWQPASFSQEAVSQVSPLHPSSHVHVSGALHFPCWQGDAQIGVSHFPGGPYPVTHEEQSAPVNPLSHVHVSGALHFPCWQGDAQIGVSHFPGGPYPVTHEEQSAPVNPFSQEQVPDPDMVPDPSQVPWSEHAEAADEGAPPLLIGQLSQFGP